MTHDKSATFDTKLGDIEEDSTEYAMASETTVEYYDSTGHELVLLAVGKSKPPLLGRHVA